MAVTSYHGEQLDTIIVSDHLKTMIDAKPREFNHYYKDVSALKSIDVYRVLELFSVTNPAIQHAVKKLLVAGGRGVKDQAKDIDEAIKALQRWQEMRREEA